MDSGCGFWIYITLILFQSSNFHYLNECTVLCDRASVRACVRIHVLRMLCIYICVCVCVYIYTLNRLNFFSLILLCVAFIGHEMCVMVGRWFRNLRKTWNKVSYLNWFFFTKIEAERVVVRHMNLVLRKYMEENR